MKKIKDINKGDVLAFKASDNQYKIIICTSVFKDKSPQNFTFAATVIDQLELPSISEILNNNFFGIGNRKNDHFQYSNDEVQTMWNIHPEIKPYHLGSYGFLIWRKDFVKFSHNFELIGNIAIVDNLDLNGNGSVNASDWEFLKTFFNKNLQEVLKSRGQQLFKVKAIVKG